VHAKSQKRSNCDINFNQMKLVYLLEAGAVGRVIGTAIDKMFMVKFILNLNLYYLKKEDIL
jgi:hypothetical protein